MKRSAAGTYPTYKQASKKGRGKSYAASKTRVGYSSAARTRGAAVTGEMKYFDCDNTGTALTLLTTTWPAGTMIDPLTTINLGSAAVANPLCLCAPITGAALNNRVGRKISIHKIKVHGTLSVAPQAAQAVADATTKARIVLVIDQQTNAAQMTGAQLFQDASAAASTVNTFQNPNNFGRFRVLKDKMFSLSNLNLAGSPTAADVIQAGIKVNFKFSVNFKKPLVVHFNATNGGTVADIVDNSIHIVAGADQITYAPALSYYTRVCYKDV